MEPRRVLITGACGNIGTVIRPALREGVEELRLSDLQQPKAWWRRRPSSTPT
jgi:nucleoside-diphosphate-sugar epimerase